MYGHVNKDICIQVGIVVLTCLAPHEEGFFSPKSNGLVSGWDFLARSGVGDIHTPTHMYTNILNY